MSLTELEKLCSILKCWEATFWLFIFLFFITNCCSIYSCFFCLDLIYSCLIYSIIQSLFKSLFSLFNAFSAWIQFIPYVFCMDWYDYMIFILYFDDVMYYFNRVFWMLSETCLPEINPIWSYYIIDFIHY